jgi:tetratricopeptide (TPR) repeat protein
LAWFLATAADPRFRDGPRAVAIARRLVEREPQNGEYWYRLGTGHYAAGDWQAAVAALEQAIRLSATPGDHLPRLFLAMAYWRAGERDKARRSYELAVASMEVPNLQRGLLLLRFRSEAERLLGLTAK